MNSLNSNDVTKNCSAHSVCMQQNENSRWVLIRSSLNTFYASLCINKTILALMGSHFFRLFYLTNIGVGWSYSGCCYRHNQLLIVRFRPKCQFTLSYRFVANALHQIIGKKSLKL